MFNPLEQSHPMVAVERGEVTFYRDDRLCVTSRCVTLASLEIPLDQVTGIEQTVGEPPNYWIFGSIGAAGLIGGLSFQHYGHPSLSLALLIVGFGAIFWILTGRRFHTVSLVKPGKSVTILESDDKEVIQAVISAIGEALDFQKTAASTPRHE